MASEWGEGGSYGRAYDALARRGGTGVAAGATAVPSSVAVDARCLASGSLDTARSAARRVAVQSNHSIVAAAAAFQAYLQFKLSGSGHQLTMQCSDQKRRSRSSRRCFPGSDLIDKRDIMNQLKARWSICLLAALQSCV